MSNSNNYGGGIFNASSMTLSNSTVSGNTASASYSAYGGGIFNQATLSLSHSTVTGNTGVSSSNGGGIWSDGGTVNLKNTIVANNPTGSDCATGSGATITSLGYNLASDSTCSLAAVGDQPNTDPLLGPLASNGGRTQTHALLNGSPALDAVPNGTNGCGDDYTTDQRDKTRPVDMLGGGAKCDVGAYERQSNELTAQECSLAEGATFDFNTLTSGINVKIMRNSGDPGCVTVLKRSVYPGLSQNTGELPIVWTISASGATYNLDLALCYTDVELGSVTESTLHTYRWNESTSGWEDKAGTVDTSNNCVTIGGVTALSPWTLAGEGSAPTAITLQAFRARSVDGLGHAGVLLAFLLFLGGGLALWQQRFGQRRRP